MRSVLRRPCAQPRCPELVQGRYCAKHQRQAHRRENARRGTSQQRGYGARWKRLRVVILARDPICVSCGLAPSVAVDHINPKSLRVDAADFAEEELQGLCLSCHGRKTRSEQRHG